MLGFEADDDGDAGGDGDGDGDGDSGGEVGDINAAAAFRYLLHRRLLPLLPPFAGEFFTVTVSLVIIEDLSQSAACT